VTAVGNHEHVPGNVSYPGGGGGHWRADFAAYSARYGVGGSGPGAAFWYAVDAGPLHLAVLSSEHAYARGSAQWAWLAADLSAVDRGGAPWVAVMLHRPVLSAAVLEWDNHCPGCPLSAALEPLFRSAGVDVVIAGHIHRRVLRWGGGGREGAHPCWRRRLAVPSAHTARYRSFERPSSAPPPVPPAATNTRTPSTMGPS
jgi:hypothetical protein